MSNIGSPNESDCGSADFKVGVAWRPAHLRDNLDELITGVDHYVDSLAKVMRRQGLDFDAQDDRILLAEALRTTFRLTADSDRVFFNTRVSQCIGKRDTDRLWDALCSIHRKDALDLQIRTAPEKSPVVSFVRYSGGPGQSKSAYWQLWVRYLSKDPSAIGKLEYVRSGQVLRDSPAETEEDLPQQFTVPDELSSLGVQRVRAGQQPGVGALDEARLSPLQEAAASMVLSVGQSLTRAGLSLLPIVVGLMGLYVTARLLQADLLTDLYMFVARLWDKSGGAFPSIR